VSCRSHDATFPILQVLGAEKSLHAVEQRFATRLRNPDQQKAVVRSGHALACVRKIEVLSDQKSTMDLTPIPHDAVVSPGNAFVGNRVDVVPEVAEELNETMRQVLVQLDLTARAPRLRGDLLGRCGCKGDRCPHIVLGQGREICEDFGCCRALREARQNRAQGDTSTLYDGLAAGDRWISVNPLLVVEGQDQPRVYSTRG
jgi:hypothetical protein